MPEGIISYVDERGDAHIEFPDLSKKQAALIALHETGAPFRVDTGGRRKTYIVPEGNAREAGLLDEVSVGTGVTPDETPATDGDPGEDPKPTIASTRKEIDAYGAAQDPPIDTTDAVNKKAALELLGISVEE